MFPLILVFLQPTLALINSPCPDVKPVENLNMTALGSGIWYEIARHPNPFEIITTCVSVDYSYHDDVINIKLRNVPFKSLYSIEGTAVLAPDAERKGKLNVSLKYGWPLNLFVLPINVLAINYDSYIVYYSCYKDSITGNPLQFAWIFARSSKLDDAVKTEIDNVLKNIDYIDSSKFVWIDHSDTVCKIGSLLGSLDSKLKL